MSFANRPDKVTCDAFSDNTLENQNPNGVYSRFTNRLTTPILNAKGLMLINANFVNPILQLNDASQLMFFYYASATQAGIATLSQLKCIRLLPSNYVPPNGYQLFTKNKYYNTVSELVAALNAAASNNGDDATYNPGWTAGQVTFSYDSATRRISVAGNATTYIAPAAADDPNVLDRLRGTTTATNRIRMNTYVTNSAGYSSGVLQPYVEQISMNARLGFAMSYSTRGLYWSSSSQQGCATSIGVPSNSSAYPVLADATPILIGAQNVNVYCSVLTGSGIDSLNGKNLLATVPLEAPALNVNSYTTNSVEAPAISLSNEIYELTFEFRDDYGTPVPFPPNYSTSLVISVYY
jgi:hypothetical protein